MKLKLVVTQIRYEKNFGNDCYYVTLSEDTKFGRQFATVTASEIEAKSLRLGDTFTLISDDCFGEK